MHEFGVWKTPGALGAGEPRAGYLPTIAFQDDTLARSRAEVERVIEAVAKAGARGLQPPSH